MKQGPAQYKSHSDNFLGLLITNMFCTVAPQEDLND